MNTITINGRKIGEGYEPFIIAEAGINHNGDLELAKKMILAAKEAGVDAVKFQTFHAEEFVQDKTTTYTYLSQGKEVTESMLEMFKRNEFSRAQWKEIKEFCDAQKITFLSTPQNVSDLELLLPLGIGAVKVGSDDFVNIPLIRRYAKESLPLLLACGMATEGEIASTLKAAGTLEGHPTCLMLCTSEYPTPPQDVNLKKLLTIQEKFSMVVPGFSDHTQGSTAATAALALGAKVFEKHFTLSHSLPGPDHWFSAEPSELKEWTTSIRRAYRMLGKAELQPTDKEKQTLTLARRSITATCDIFAGEVLTENNIGMRRPGTGISPDQWDEIIGKHANKPIKAYEQFCLKDIF
jgi:N,N'-diacetyllegionaminate synthase